MSAEAEPKPRKMSTKAKFGATAILVTLAAPILGGGVIGDKMGAKSEKHKNARELARAKEYRRCVAYFGKLGSLPEGTKIKIDQRVLDGCGWDVTESKITSHRWTDIATSQGFATQENIGFTTTLKSPDKLLKKASDLEQSGMDYSHWGEVQGVGTGLGVGLIASMGLLVGMGKMFEISERRQHQEAAPQTSAQG